jgi:hypothetical protein
MNGRDFGRTDRSVDLAYANLDDSVAVVTRGFVQHTKSSVMVNDLGQTWWTTRSCQMKVIRPGWVIGRQAGRQEDVFDT